MPTYRCYYARHPVYVSIGSRAVVEQYQRTGDWSPVAKGWFTDYGVPATPPQLFTVARLRETHTLVREVEAASLEAAFATMQIERWSSSELQRFERIIEEHDLTHTTMCAGDVFEDVSTELFYECDLVGWRVMV